MTIAANQSGVLSNGNGKLDASSTLLPATPPLHSIPTPLPASHNMMRQQLLRSLPRSQRLASLNATRAFASSAPRPAEVELTIGTLPTLFARQFNPANTRIQMAKRFQ